MATIYQKLSSVLKNNKNILIMTHKNPDLDGFSSALCLNKIIENYNNNSDIILPKNKLDKTINNSIKLLKCKNIAVNFVNKIDKKYDLLIIVDTSKKELLENQNVLDQIEKKVIIDHHMLENHDIDNTLFEYIDSSKSSVVEILIQYLENFHQKISPIIATIMLAGLEIDTNNFNIKTTEETHKSAAYLFKLGADNIQKQEILQQSKSNIVKRQKFIKNSYMINKNMIMCSMDDKIYDKTDLAIIADELLKFDKVQVSFVVGKIKNDTIGISARSIGKTNVEEIMKKFGGGGHTTDAAAEITNSSINQLKEKLINILK